MRTELIELVLKVQRMRSPEKLSEMLDSERDADKISIISHRFAQLTDAQADASQPGE